MEKHIFRPKIKLSSSQTPKWFTSNIRDQFKCFHTLQKKYKHLAQAVKDLRSSIHQAKANFVANLVQQFVSHNNPKNIPVYQENHKILLHFKFCRL